MGLHQSHWTRPAAFGRHTYTSELILMFWTMRNTEPLNWCKEGTALLPFACVCLSASFSGSRAVTCTTVLQRQCYLRSPLQVTGCSQQDWLQFGANVGSREEKLLFFTPKRQQKPHFRGLGPLPLPRPVTTPTAPDSRAATALLMETFASAKLNQFHRQGKATSFSLGKPTPVLRPPRPDMKEKCHSWLNNSAQKIKYVAQAFERKRKSGCHAFSCPDSHALCEGCQVLLQTQFVLPWQ